MKKYFSSLTILCHSVSWLLDDLSWVFIRPFYSRLQGCTDSTDFTIGITTYKDRFENCLKPLLSKISILFPNQRIIVVANGHFLHDEQTEFIDKIEKFCSGFKNVELKSYSEPKGLSLIWNTIIKQAPSERVIILNDDLKIRAGFRKFILKSGILDSRIAVINSSWSHYMIMKEICRNVGWFDECLLEIGGEDDDFAARLAIYNFNIAGFKTSSIKSKNRRKLNRGKINSYGRDMTKERGGYSTANTEYLESKWIMADAHFEGAVFVPNRKPKFWKLRNASKESNDLK